MVTAVVMNALPVIFALYLRWHRAYAPYPLLKGLSKPDFKVIGESLRLGISIGGTYAVESGMFTVATLCMGVIGSTALAAHQIAIQSVYVAFMVPMGLSYAVTFRIGQHYGAGRLFEARRAGRLGIGFGASCMFAFAALFWLAPELVIGLFIDHNDPANRDVVQLAVSLLAIAAWFELFDGTQCIAMGAIRGLKDARTTFLVGLAGYWLVGRTDGAAAGLPAGWGPSGVWWGLASGLACAAIGLTLASRRRHRDCCVRACRPRSWSLADRVLQAQRTVGAKDQETRELRQRQRAADPVTLDLVTAELAQLILLGGGLDAFGDHFQVQVVRQVDHGPYQLQVFRAHVHAADETLVDLQQGDRQAVEVHEGGEAGTEIVQREAHAQPAEGLHGLQDLVAAAHHAVSVSSNSSHWASTPRSRISRSRVGSNWLSWNWRNDRFTAMCSGGRPRPRSHCMSRRAREMTQ